MTRTLQTLAAIAAIQVILIALTFSGSADLHGKSDSSILLDFNRASIDRLIIAAANGHKTELSKQQGQWQTTEAFPADQAKLDSLLDKLENLKAGLPVATSKEALQRFKVANNEFERHVVLQQGDTTLAELFVGSGAGARQSHVRRAGQQAIYTAAIGSYDLSTASDNWQDKTVTGFDMKNLATVTLGDLALQRDNSSDGEHSQPGWQALSLEDGKTLNQEAVNTSLDALSRLRFSKILGKESKPEYGLDKPLLSVEIETHRGKRQYQFGQLKDTEDYVLKLSDRDEYFKINATTAKSLLDKFSQEKWLQDRVEHAKESSDEVSTTAEQISAQVEDSSNASTADTEAGP